MIFFKRFLAVFCFLVLAQPASAEPYTIDHAVSTVSFTGAHAGNPFQGIFHEWAAAIDFDANKLPISRIDVTFNPASAKTGNKLYDGTLPQADWFDVKEFPTARFVSTGFSKNPDGAFVVTGDLTIRGITRSISFPFTLSDPARPPVRVKAQLPIDRLAFDIGKKSDAKAEWVSATINVSIDLLARQ